MRIYIILYDADNIRTWRTICPRSEVQYSEDSPALALMLYFLPSLYFFPVYLFCVFTHVASLYPKLLEQKKAFTQEKSSTPTRLVWDTNMAAVSLFWDKNMATMKSCENNQLVALVISYTFHITIIVIFNVVIG